MKSEESGAMFINESALDKDSSYPRCLVQAMRVSRKTTSMHPVAGILAKARINIILFILIGLI